MAIDTQAKRMSALLQLAPAVIPDGSIAASDRATLSRYYSALSVPAPDPGPGASTRQVTRFGFGKKRFGVYPTPGTS